jgi:hypothetical protein
MAKAILKPDIEYPKEIYVVPFSYSDYREKDWEQTEENDLAVYIEMVEAEDNTGESDGEAWIAVYELKELVRVKRSAAIKDRVGVK